MYFLARPSALFEMLPFILHPSFDNDAAVNSFELSGIPSGGISGGGISEKADRKKRNENAKAEESKRVEIIRRGVGKDE